MVVGMFAITKFFETNLVIKLHPDENDISQTSILVNRKLMPQTLWIRNKITDVVKHWREISCESQEVGHLAQSVNM